MTTPSAVHGTFVLVRQYPVPPSKVFHALSDPEAKGAWFAPPPGWDRIERQMDFSVGGRELSEVKSADGVTHRFVARYYDIVPDARVVFAYEMYLDDRRISVSVATMELEAVDGGTQLTLTEQGVFLDGADDVAAREAGTVGLLDALGRAVTG